MPYHEGGGGGNRAGVGGGGGGGVHSESYTRGARFLREEEMKGQRSLTQTHKVSCPLEHANSSIKIALQRVFLWLGFHSYRDTCSWQQPILLGVWPMRHQAPEHGHGHGHGAPQSSRLQQLDCNCRPRKNFARVTRRDTQNLWMKSRNVEWCRGGCKEEETRAIGGPTPHEMRRRQGEEGDGGERQAAEGPKKGTLTSRTRAWPQSAGGASRLVAMHHPSKPRASVPLPRRRLAAVGRFGLLRLPVLVVGFKILLHNLQQQHQVVSPPHTHPAAHTARFEARPQGLLPMRARHKHQPRLAATKPSRVLPALDGAQRRARTLQSGKHATQVSKSGRTTKSTKPG